MKQNYQKPLGALLFLSLCWGCAPNQGGMETPKGKKFKQLLEKGRRVEAGPLVTEALEGFNLTGTQESIVSIESDERTGKPSWVLYNTLLTPTVPYTQLLNDAIAVLRENEEFLGLTLDQWVAPPEWQDLSERLSVVHFTRTYNGLEVRDARLSIYYSLGLDQEWHLREISHRGYGDIEIANLGAKPAGAAYFNEYFAQGVEILGERVLLFPRTKDEKYWEFFEAKEFKLKSLGDLQEYTITVAHGSLEILEAFSHHYQAGSLAAKVYQKGYLDNATVEFPLAFSTLRVDNQPQVLNAEGEFVLNAPRTAQVDLSGPRVSVYLNNTAAITTLSASLSNTAKATITGANAGEVQALNAFSAIQRVNRFARQYLKESEASVIAENLPLRYNYIDPNAPNDRACNAYFDPNVFGLFFFPQGSAGNLRCPSMVEVGSVVYHEWGHALDFRTGRVKNNISDGAYSEGIGDIVSGFYEGLPGIGVGFMMNNSQPLRTLENPKIYPRDLVNQVHEDGMIIGATFWDLRKALIARYGETKGANLAHWLFFRQLLETDAFLDAYQAVQRVADNDGNPASKGPQYCLINKTFAARGLATLEANCTDVEDNNVPLVPDLSLAVQSEKANDEVMLMASANQEGLKLGLCLAERYFCTLDPKNPAAKPTSLNFKFEGLSAQGKQIYISESSLKLQELGAITLIAKDQNGNLVGARAFRSVIK